MEVGIHKLHFTDDKFNISFFAIGHTARKWRDQTVNPGSLAWINPIKEPLDESQRGEWKTWLKTQHSEN